MIWNGSLVVINEGQLVTGRKELSRESGIPESTIEDILSYLERQHQIQQQKTTKYRLITILNWKEYQNPTSNPTPKQQQSDTNNNVKNEKNFTAKADFFIEEEKPIKVPKEGATRYNELCSWLQGVTGAPMPNKAKQFAHLKAAKEAGITISQLKDRAEELWAQPFYQTNGMDWGAVVSSFNRRA